MTLPAPILDDRSYAQLRDELVRRIPVYAPEWTDHNESDPGIALLELLAFLGENVLFRFNQIPESTYLAFLRLLDVPLLPGGVARGLLAATTTETTGTLVEQGSVAKAGSLPFQTTVEVTAWPLSLVGAVRTASEAPTDPDLKDFAQQSLDALDLDSDDDAAFYVTELLPEDPSAPSAEPVDVDRSVDGSLWLAVLAEKGASLDALGAATLNIGFLPDDDPGAMGDRSPCPGPGDGLPTPPVLWEVSVVDAGSGDPAYRTLTPLADTTRGLTAPGVIRLRLPSDPSQLGVTAGALPELDGTGDRPPVLEDDEQAAKVLFWLRATRPDRGSLGKVRWAGINTTWVEQAQAALPELVGTGTGNPGQRLRLVHAPVIDDQRLVVESEEAPGQWVRWTQVDDLAASGPTDHHFTLDPQAGELRFGGGPRGLAPQIGRRIRASAYRYGGGSQGNVPAGAISEVDGQPLLKPKNPVALTGGSEPETVPTALERIPGEIRRHDRAVTATDFQELALLTPGGGVGRAECLPRFHPHFPDLDPAAGVVSVVVWPKEDPAHPSAPMPTATLLRDVCAQLDARRLVTTELYVIPPTYRKVAVSVGLQVKNGYGTDAVRRWVELILRQYLAPLPPYGPEGAGWPLGRRVYGPELEAAALQVEGVEFLEGLAVAGLAEDGVTWETGTVELERWEVPELTSISVVTGPPLDPGAPVEPPALTPAPVPVPVIKETC